MLKYFIQESKIVYCMSAAESSPVNRSPLHNLNMEKQEVGKNEMEEEMWEVMEQLVWKEEEEVWLQVLVVL